MSLRFVFPLSTAALVLLTAACSKAPEHTDTSAPTVAGDRVVFPTDSPQRAALAVAAAEPRATEVHILNGRLAWDEDATVRIYTPVAGRVQSVAVARGEQVAAQAALARLDSPDFGQAQADARKAGADLLLAERTLTRTKDLFEHGAAARKDLDTAENAYAGAQSEQQRAAVRLTLYGAPPAGSVDGFFTLRTPLAGVVVEKNINLGQEVRPDQVLANAPQLFAPLFVVSDPMHLWVLVDATERDVTALLPGLAFIVRSPAFPDRTFSGHVEWVSDSLDPTTRMITVHGRVDNAERQLKAEMFVTVEFESAGTSGLAVPARAVFMKGGKHYLFVEAEPGTYVRHEVEAGPEREGKILVLRGLKPSQRVVTDGSLLLDELQAGAGGN